jgi:mono/diheme cytochrome c family protein
MKKAIKIVLGILLLVVVGVISLAAYVKVGLPNVGDPEDLKIEYTADRIERGRYLANSVAVCMDCHSSRDWSKFAGPIGGNFGGGGEMFGKEMGFPGTIYAANITPFNLGNWTDGEIFRTITTGVNKHGKALFPVMPYHNYGQLDREDIYSIISYIRTLEPITSNHPERVLDFPVNYLVNTMPRKAALSTRPNESDQLAYGKYMVTAAGCMHCHSKTDKGVIVPGSEFGGGMEFNLPGGLVRSPNITPDKETGIGDWTKEVFMGRFRTYTDSTYQSPVFAMDDLNSPMPWTMYADMNDYDLESIFAYLQSLEPISHAVTIYTKKK